MREAKGLFIVESEYPQFLRTVPLLPRDPRYPDKISDVAKPDDPECPEESSRMSDRKRGWR